MSMFEGFKPPDLANGINGTSANMSLKKVGNTLLPLESAIINVLNKIALANKVSGVIFPHLPLILTIVDIFALLILPILIVLVTIFPTRGFGINFSQNLYSIFYLIQSALLFFLLFYFANPVLEKVSKTTEDESSSKIDNVINELFSIYNNIINASVIPVMMTETLFLTLIIFFISIMFIITISLSRTYFAIHCKYGQEIKPLWWAYIIDFFMHIALIVFFILLCVFQVVRNLPIGKILPQTLLLYSRRIFVIALVYYVLKLLFSLLEWTISNNILAISKWKEPNYTCQSKEEETKDKTAINIFLLILNILGCIIIWVILLILVGGHIYIGAFYEKYVGKGFNILDLVCKALLFLFSGKISLSSVEKKITAITNTASSIIPGGIPGGIPDIISTGKAEIEKELEKNPNFSIQDMLSSVIAQASQGTTDNGFDDIIQKRNPKETNIPNGVPVDTNIPNGVPVDTNIPMAVPVDTNIPMAVPVDLPMAVPVQTDLPMAVPVQTDLPMAVPSATKLTSGLAQVKAFAEKNGLSNLLKYKGSTQDKAKSEVNITSTEPDTRVIDTKEEPSTPEPKQPENISAPEPEKPGP